MSTRTMARTVRGLATVFVLVSLMYPCPCAGAESSTNDQQQAHAPKYSGTSESIHAQDQNVEASRWFFLLGSVNNHPRLSAAEKKIDRQINRPFRVIAPGFENVKTFADQSDEFMIWNTFGGVGRTFGDNWDAFVQLGYSAGQVRTKATDPSLLLLPLHTDVTEKRSSFFAGLGLTYFPLGIAERDRYHSIGERLKKAKPFVGTALNWNYLTFDGDVKAGLKPFGSLMKVEKSEHWSPWAVGLCAGVDIPLTRRSVLALNGQYSFFLDYDEDFSGPGLSIFTKTFF